MFRHTSRTKAASLAAFAAAVAATAVASPAIATPADRGVELVTPADDGAYPSGGFVAQGDGNALYWLSGAVGFNGTGDPAGEDAGGPDYFLQRRGAGGWTGRWLTKDVAPSLAVRANPVVGMDVDGALYATDANLVPEDTNVNDPLFGPYVDDLYRVLPDAPTLISSPPGGNSAPTGLARENPFNNAIPSWPTTPDLATTGFFTDSPFLDDGDSARDVYLRDDDSLALVSRNVDGTPNDSGEPADIANTAFDPFNFAAVEPPIAGGFPASKGSSPLSEDGSSMLITTAAALDPADADTAQDLYLWRDGSLQLVSGRVDGAAEEVGVTFDGMSADGSQIYFNTTEPLLAADPQPDSRDVYRYAVGAPLAERLTLASGGAADPAVTVAVAETGALVFGTVARIGDDPPAAGPDPVLYRGTTTGIRTIAALVPGDSALEPQSQPIPDQPGFESSATLTALSVHQRPVRLSRSGDTVVFVSVGQLVGADTDAEADVYLWRAGSGLTLVSGGTGPYPALLGGPGAEGFRQLITGSGGRGMTPDGSRVYFTSADALTSEAPDNGMQKVYEWTASGLTLISSDNPDAAHARYVDNSDDGSSVFFETTDSLTAYDADAGMLDTYVARVGGGFPPPPTSGVGGPAPSPGGSSGQVPSPPAIGSQNQNPEPPAPPAPPIEPQPELTVDLGDRSINGRRRAVTFRIDLSAPGSVTARLFRRSGGKALGVGKATFDEAVQGAEVKLRLTRKGRRHLRGETRRLELRVAATPADGGARVAESFRVTVRGVGADR